MIVVSQCNERKRVKISCSTRQLFLKDGVFAFSISLQLTTWGHSPVSLQSTRVPIAPSLLLGPRKTQEFSLLTSMSIGMLL